MPLFFALKNLPTVMARGKYRQFQQKLRVISSILKKEKP